MQPVQFMRASDNVITRSEAIDPGKFAGRWISSDPDCRGIARLDLEVRNHVVTGTAFGADRGQLFDWGTATASHVFADGVDSSQCAGFLLGYQLGFMESHIQANLKLGVLVLGVHHSFGNSARGGCRDYFFREFMSMGTSGTEPDVRPRGSHACAHDFGLGQSNAAVARLLGSWANTNQQSLGMTRIDLRRDGDRVRVRIFGRGDHAHAIDWGEQPAHVFSCAEEDGVPSAAVLAQYAFAFFECELQFRQNKGILAVTTFNRFKDDSGRQDYVTRELFHRRANEPETAN